MEVDDLMYSTVVNRKSGKASQLSNIRYFVKSTPYH
jgi:hypothetical protein